MSAPSNATELTDACRAKFQIYAQLLAKWQRSINLVGASTLNDVWRRHFDDSLQLLPLASEWKHWVDLGSGAGFPGLAIALASQGSGQSMHLIESDRRKAAFLREVSRETQTDVNLHIGRIEDVLPSLISSIQFDVVSARALAPLGNLIAYAHPLLENGAVGLFLKGKGLSAELTESMAVGSLNLSFVDSRTDVNAKIVVVRGYRSRTNSV
jgi:16S rRNA (guanine527-N7)-methyltransferase